MDSVTRTSISKYLNVTKWLPARFFFNPEIKVMKTGSYSATIEKVILRLRTGKTDVSNSPYLLSSLEINLFI